MTDSDFDFAVAQLRALAKSKDQHIRVRAAEALARLAKTQSTRASSKEEPFSISPDVWIPWAADEILAEIDAGRVSAQAVRKYLTPVLRVLPENAWEETARKPA